MTVPVEALEGVDYASARVALPPWPFLDSVSTALETGDDRIAAFRQALADGDASLRQRFADDEPVEALVRDRARMVDVLLRKACPAGARVAYVSVRPDRDYMGGENVIWIDPMWDWPDACVPIDGYDVPLLAATAMFTGAIAWEIYRLSAQP